MIEKKNKELEDKAKVGQIQSDLSITTTHTTHIHGGRQKLIDFLVAILDSKVTEVKRIIWQGSLVSFGHFLQNYLAYHLQIRSTSTSDETQKSIYFQAAILDI